MYVHGRILFIYTHTHTSKYVTYEGNIVIPLYISRERTYTVRKQKIKMKNHLHTYTHKYNIKYARVNT